MGSGNRALNEECFIRRAQHGGYGLSPIDAAVRAQLVYMLYTMRPRHQAGRIHKRLMLALFKGEYPPGTPLSEVSIAATFRVSRTPVREALSQLVNEGFAERVSGHGVFAARVTIQTLRDVLEVRRLLEGEAAAWAASRASRLEVARMRELAVFQYAVGDAASYRHATDRNRTFHEAIAAASHNDQVVGLIGQGLAQMERS
ncbi:MAG: GntR family transcriptional regulator, partial [Acidobacteriota bacterium]